MATPTYTAIASITLGSSASSVEFSSIPQDYRDLVLVVESSTVSGIVRDIDLRLNGDTGNNYNTTSMFGDGSNDFAFIQANSDEANIGRIKGLGNMRFSLMDYSATDKHKTGLSIAGSADSDVRANAIRWADTSAVTSMLIRISQGLDDFTSGSTFALYGIEA